MRWPWKREPQTPAERVANGVTLLDAKRSSWVDEIDLDDLTLASFTRCVLGQLYGTFCDGAQSLRITDREGLFGFEVDFSACDGTFGPAYRELETEWRRVIQERRAVAS